MREEHARERHGDGSEPPRRAGANEHRDGDTGADERQAGTAELAMHALAVGEHLLSLHQPLFIQGRYH